MFIVLPGPATVRMVSNNGPPMPIPMQVPPGHMVQQIIDENGILTNVILSSQPPGIAAPPMMSYYVSARLDIALVCVCVRVFVVHPSLSGTTTAQRGRLL